MKHFTPLESNPTVFTGLARDLGLSGSLQFEDVFGLDDDSLAMLPRPVHALVLVFPTDEQYEQRRKEDAKIWTTEPSKDVVWFEQTIHNACGLYGLLHAVCNGGAKGEILPDTILDHIVSSYPVTKPSARHKILEDSTELEKAYQKAALEGDSEAPANPADEVDFHYTCFVKSATSGGLYQLDGDRSGAIYVTTLGSDDDVLCEAGLKVIQSFMDAQGGNQIGFSLLALVPS